MARVFSAGTLNFSFTSRTFFKKKRKKKNAQGVTQSSFTTSDGHPAHVSLVMRSSYIMAWIIF
jgi:hypothetical protein